MEIDCKLRCLLFKPIKDARIINNPNERKSIIYDRPDKKRWEELKQQEINRLKRNTRLLKYTTVTEYEYGKKKRS